MRSYSATVLTWVSAVGVIGTAVLAARATPKATLLLAKAEKEKGGALTKVEAVSAAAPAYAPTLLVGAGTICCLFGANILNKRQQAVVTGAYAMLSNYHKEYRETLKELYGEEADEKIQSVMARRRCDYHQTNLEAPDRKVIWYDEISGESIARYEREIMDAEYHFNRNYTMRGYALLNELYEFLGLPPTEYGSRVGWSMADGIEWVDFEHRLLSRDDGGTDIYAIDMIFSPEELEEWKR